MRVISCELRNFASYAQLDFDFRNQGLTLVSGPTGSGKSTLMDAVPWILFGHTSKGGKIDEILSWGAKGPTIGTIRLDSGIVILRSRSPNDLYYYRTSSDCVDSSSIDSSAFIRGRDLADTQRQINSLLGFDCEQYLSGAYFHEFSQPAQFFTTTAKNRRQICEQLVDLSMAKKLQINASDKRKLLDKARAERQSDIRVLEASLASLRRVQELESTKSQRWIAEHDKTIAYVTSTYDKFENSRKRTISNVCRECGTVLAHPHDVIDESINPHLGRLEALLKEENPHSSAVRDYSGEIDLGAKNIEANKALRDKYSQEIADLEILLSAVETFRSALIDNTVCFIECEANRLLTNYFDAEIRISLEPEAADRLNVVITKDGNAASFTQLSKGQRQLLKLCFGVAVMSSVENHLGVHFDQIFFDEALDGFDEVFKTKAYRLLESLAVVHESVFVVEHSEGLKSMFPNAWSVSLVNGHSEICQN